MHLSDEQLQTLREWARSTPEAGEVRLFGRYAKGTAHEATQWEEASDVDVAVGASSGNWTALAETWERDLSQKLGLEVSVRTLLNSAVQKACDECSILLSE